ncbi:MAG: hypothetical protein ACJ751_12970 [Niastella sp.]|jgi:hypothetical protein|uniref:hypothetical protein n=1 Tax=Niastella sp. TaxID=1869183 RepID=UPI00389A5566
MAKQDGFVKLKGNLDDISFYRTKDGYMARKTVRLDPKRLERDPAFARTREAMGNFKKGASGGKLLRNALNKLLKKASDKRMSNRLFSKMIAVINADATNKRGLKNIIDGETELLKDFEFNLNAPITQSFTVKYDASIDRVTGALLVKIPSFITEEVVKAPFEATHYQVHIAGLELDFENGTYVSEFKDSEPFSLKATAVNAFDLAVNLPANSKHPLFLALGVTFWVEDLGELFPIKNGAYNALAMVQVSGV